MEIGRVGLTPLLKLVRFSRESGQTADLSVCPLCAKSGLCDATKLQGLVIDLAGDGEDSNPRGSDLIERWPAVTLENVRRQFHSLRHRLETHRFSGVGGPAVWPFVPLFRHLPWISRRRFPSFCSLTGLFLRSSDVNRNCCRHE